MKPLITYNQNLIFGLTTLHTGPIGNTPDVVVKKPDWCGIIDTKAYKNGYSISGSHKRVMIDVYIPTYQTYAQTTAPLAFFTYVAPYFIGGTDTTLQEIEANTGVPGSAITVDQVILIAKRFLSDEEMDNNFIRDVLSVGRRVQLANLPWLT